MALAAIGRASTSRRCALDSCGRTSAGAMSAGSGGGGGDAGGVGGVSPPGGDLLPECAGASLGQPRSAVDFEMVCRTVVEDLRVYGLCVIDGFLGNERGLAVRQEVLDMYSSGVFKVTVLTSFLTRPDSLIFRLCYTDYDSYWTMCWRSERVNYNRPMGTVRPKSIPSYWNKCYRFVFARYLLRFCII